MYSWLYSDGDAYAIELDLLEGFIYQMNTIGLRVRVMVFNATFNNISVISWQSVLLVEETGVPGENHRPVTSH